ncbi:hypothetical protein [Variovorax sp. 770b2]|nr:hypothetical protein [Variovorax sp. 770b2]
MSTNGDSTYENDELAAEAIGEAVGRSTMRFIAAKTIDRSAILVFSSRVD